MLAQAVDVKVNNPWKYDDNLCFCEEKEETQIHLSSCKKLETDDDKNSVEYEKLYLGNNKEKTEIAKKFEKKVKFRNKMRKESMKTNEVDEYEENYAEIDENEETDDEIETNEETDDAAA